MGHRSCAPGAIRPGSPSPSPQVSILDYDEPRYVNFEAEVNFPEEEGIVQVENFGVHIHEQGFLAYGLVVDGIMDRCVGRSRSSLPLPPFPTC